MTAALLALIAVRFFPSNLFNPPSAQAFSIISPIPDNLNIDIHPPTQITIPSLDIKLPIAQAQISGNSWTLYNDKVSWLTTSKLPGFGNVILYAHNRRHLFGPLKNIEVGEQIIVEQEGKNYTYLVSEKRKVLPDNVEAILSSRDQLTLYTCDGSFDQRRLVVIALPQENNL
ncbi:sortase [Candidatus Daviesbacteria bacterium]|nr:sortase [Candidatus Daviesbacteria bacterium]